MKTFVTTIPKAGTYLMRELLEQIGLVSSHRHISPGGTNDYSKVSIEVGRRNPRACFTKMSLKESFNAIPENSFAMGHIGYTPEIEGLLKSFNVIFLERDFKEAMLSRMIFYLDTGRKRNDVWTLEKDKKRQFIKFIDINGESMAEQHHHILLWKDKEYVECFNFGEILATPEEQIQRLAKIHNVDLSDEEVSKIAANSIGKKTLTKSRPINKEEYWSYGAHQKLDELIKKYKIGTQG